MNDSMRNCDVIIIGASLAGSCLARQLKLKHPELDIVVLEKKTEFGHWVGESTLEVFWDYAARHLDLGPYLDRNYFLKHGLRFFFDSKAKDLPFDRLSEFGRTWIHRVPAHQLDRARFDSDVCAMNVAMGVEVRLGEAATDVTIDAMNGHRVQTKAGEYRCRWLVDASGFAAIVSRKLGVHRSQAHRHPVSSYWGRFRHLRELDLQGGMEWRARVNHTSRVLSTNHFMYPGYWIWMIPLDAETISVGVTIHAEMRPDLQIRNSDDLMRFFQSHAGLNQLVAEETTLLDFHALKALPRCADRAYHEERVFLTGMASSVIEPVLSPGCAHLADSNRMIGDLIATDLLGLDQEFREKALAYSVYTRVWFEAILIQIQGLYTGLFDVHMAFFEPALYNYFGVILPTSMSERWGYEPGRLPPGAQYEAVLAEALKSIGDGTVLKNLEARARELQEFLVERGIEFENNDGRFFDSEAPPAVLRHTHTNGQYLSPEAVGKVHETLYEFCLAYSLRRMAAAEKLNADELAIKEVAALLQRSQGSLWDGLDALRRRPTAGRAATMAAAAPAE